MGKLLQINPVIRETTSTGRIMREIGELAVASGWDSYIAYGKARDGKKKSSFSSKLIPIGDKLDLALHFLATRLFDAHGLASQTATRKFVRSLRMIDPDVIHIHNIHGYFLNYKILFRYLKESGKPVVWTVHDCWLFTGHCYHYSAAGCMKWKLACGNCPQKKAFPKSIFLDRSRNNFRDKKTAFTSLGEHLTVVTVSDWMRLQMQDSFLGGCNFKVINNGIDLDVFKPLTDEALLKRLKVTGKKIILGVASIWLKEKGLEDFAELAGKLEDDKVVVLIGKITASQKAMLPESVITVERTSDHNELACLYSSSLVLVNPTWQDNYPTVNLEATACGTPVITYRTGGSPESIEDGKTGFVIEQGNVEGILSAIHVIESSERKEWRDRCRSYAIKHFSKGDKYQEYIDLYESLAAR